ncbi:MAG: hypothetical protein Q8P03_01425 [bacterium]|nr:hypothetical protein [bacterium]
MDYGRRVEEFLGDESHYQGPDPRITSENFPPTHTGRRRVRMTFARFVANGWAESEALAAFKEKGLRPADLREVLTFGEKYEGALGGASIVPLGSPLQIAEGRVHPVLHESRDSARNRYLDILSLDWHYSNADFPAFALIDI